MPTPSAAPAKPRAGLDLVVVLVLIAALVGMIVVTGRTRRRAADAGAATPAGAGAEAHQLLPEQIGYRETSPLEFPDPVHALASDPRDRLYVATGLALVELGGDGTERRRFDLPTPATCLALADDTLYLGCGDHLEVLTLDDGRRTAWPSLGADSVLASVAVSGDTVLAGDKGLRLVQRWRRDGTPLTPFTVSGAAAPTAGPRIPGLYLDVAAAPDGTVWVTDVGGFGLVHLTADGQALGRFGQGSPALEDFGSCCNPVHVAVTPAGLLITADKQPALVKAYRDDGSFVTVVAPPAAFRPITFIADAAVDHRGRVLVADPKAKAVRVFEPIPEAP